MSHYSVIVATNAQPTDNELHEIMQPWHEFECTGTDDRFVVEVDETDEKFKEYDTGTQAKLRDREGGLHCPYDDQFYREFTGEEKAKHRPIGSGCGGGMSWTSKDWGDGLGYRAKAKFVPGGFEQVELPFKELMTFEEFLCSNWYTAPRLFVDQTPSKEHKYGYVLIEGGQVKKAVTRTNPDAKWDWWVVGGRFSGSLRSVYADGSLNQCRVGHLDKAAMKAAAVAKRKGWAEECATKASMSLGALTEACNQLRSGHAAWLGSEERPRGGGYYDWLDSHGYSLAAKAGRPNFELPDTSPGQSVEEWIDAAPLVSSFAFVKDGRWFEKGRMGWFAAVSDENPNWASEFQDLLNGTSDDSWITVIDCHT